MPYDDRCAASESRWFSPFRRLGGLPRPGLLPPVYLSEQPAVPGLTWSSWHHTAEPRWVTSCEVILWSNQALGGEGQHSYHPRRKPLQQQVAALNMTLYLWGCIVWENFSRRFYSCLNVRCCFQVLHVFASQASLQLRALCCDLWCGLYLVTPSFISILMYWQHIEEGSFHWVGAPEVYVLWRLQSRTRENAN